MWKILSPLPNTNKNLQSHVGAIYDGTKKSICVETKKLNLTYSNALLPGLIYEVDIVQMSGPIFGPFSHVLTLLLIVSCPLCSSLTIHLLFFHRPICAFLHFSLLFPPLITAGHWSVSYLMEVAGQKIAETDPSTAHISLNMSLTMSSSCVPFPRLVSFALGFIFLSLLPFPPNITTPTPSGSTQFPRLHHRRHHRLHPCDTHTTHNNAHRQP